MDAPCWVVAAVQRDHSPSMNLPFLSWFITVCPSIHWPLPLTKNIVGEIQFERKSIFYVPTSETKYDSRTLEM